MEKAVDVIKNIKKKDAEIIDRYIYDVSRKVGIEQNELQKELLYNIAEMLPENPQRDDIERVLKELGNPNLLAIQYKKDSHYLISPATYLDYIRILKLVFVIVFIAMSSVGIIADFFELEHITLVNIIILIMKNVFTGLYVAALNSFFWVTLTFIFIDKNAQKTNYEWEINDLPEINEVDNRFKKGSTIAGLVFTIIFSIIIIMIALFKPNVIAWYSGNEVIPLFNSDVLLQFVPGFILIAIGSIIISILKLYYKKWNKKILIPFLIYNIISTIIILLFINSNNLINEAFINKIVQYQVGNYLQIMNSINIGILIASVVIIIAFIYDTYDAIKNTYKK